MDSVKANYRCVVEQVLRDYADFLGNDEMVQVEHIFDRERDRYLLVETGWNDGDRVYGTLLHIDIIGDRLWVQQDRTEEGVVGELMDAGINRDCIVLGFQPLEKPQKKELLFH
ncbi:MAG: XisI protein [Calothrix sp. MO_192.B10]|nr:XisI protein [Calothrix sp. MO_192.B10]